MSENIKPKLDFVIKPRIWGRGDVDLIFPYYLLPPYGWNDEEVQDTDSEARLCGFYFKRSFPHKTSFPPTRKSRPSAKLNIPPSFPRDPSIFECTTFLQCLPYTGLPEEEQKEVDVEIEDFKQTCGLDPSKLTKEILYSHFPYPYVTITGLNPGYPPVRVGPALQVISVTISNTDTNWSNLICGQITLSDYQGNEFFIYGGDVHNSKSLMVSHNMNQLLLDHAPIVPVLGGAVKFSISNKDDGSKMFDGLYDVNESTEDANKEKSTLVLAGKGDYRYYRAKMEFIKVPFAFIAKIETFLLYTPTTNGDQHFKVHGKIIVDKVVCFDKKSEEEGVQIIPKEKSSFHQEKGVFVAVQSFSPIVVQVSLFRGDLEVLNDTIKVYRDSKDVRLRQSLNLCLPCKEDDYIFCLDVHWIRHEDFFNGEYGDSAGVVNVKWIPEFNPLCQIDEPPATETSPPYPYLLTEHMRRYNSGQMDSQTLLKTTSFLSSFYAELGPPPATSNDYVEIFSVFLGGGDSSDPPYLCGSIVVQDGGGSGPVYIFSRNGCPDRLSNEKFRTLSLAWPTDRCVVEKDFYMHFKLEDDKGRSVCRGGLHVGKDIESKYHSRMHDTRYGRRICDVIRGKDLGYFAAVHYSIFRNGKRAKVSIEWVGEGGLVYGSIYAEYMNYDYPSTYDKEYYRSIIFKRSEEDGVEVKSNSRLPLSKNNVSAPSNCTGLCIHVSLGYTPKDDSDCTLRGFGADLEFEAGKTDVRSLDDITVKVEWPPSNGSTGSGVVGSSCSDLS